MVRYTLPLSLCLLISAGCSSSKDSSPYGENDTNPIGDGDGDGSGDGDGDGTGDGDGDGDGTDSFYFDVNSGGDGGGNPEGGGDGCKAVDFLFVIDNSGSMQEEQGSLLASFPGFIGEIDSTLDEAQDYHIMVVDTDHWVFAGCELLNCGAFPPLPGICDGFTCGDQPGQCEDVLGGGVVHPKGANSSNQDCNFANGKRFIDSTEEDNLVGTFNCAALVGTDSTDDPERPMEAMVNALGDSPQAVTCNDGFLRDDAILVVTFITDEDDDAGDGSAGDVDAWRNAVIEAKNGDESAVVVLGLFGDNDQPNGVCDELVDSSGAEPSVRLRQFVDSWGDHGVAGSICEDNFVDFFGAAVDIIDTTCDEFDPPG